ncbi:homoserine kinase [Fulvivirga sp. 29W222]|uniref:Homoserine kinase n=1 Tax=Fulvivirga marina TaxID=2494733 RepID=A0A937KEI8_9BACT|nr:homoserine kinase [Fulvivirga marina]MBL6449807.1 homoserine kinase [Fulvivirga marina]
MEKKIKVFAPATVANVGPGFDIFGLALEGIGDELEVSLRDDSQIKILPIEGYEDLPTDPSLNVAGVAIQSMLDELDSQQGFEIVIKKRVMPGSGLGSSASSSAAAVYAANELLGRPFSKKELVPFAMEGEKATSGKAHADNVTPSLLGGFTLVRSYTPLDVVSIPFPAELYVAVVHPQIEVKTSDSKRILKREVALDMAISQWGNVAGLVTGLACGDFDLIGRSLEDRIVEPIRSVLIPGYEDAKQHALASGALGCSISGSGPSIFALTEGKAMAEKVAQAFDKYYTDLGIEHKVYISGINAEGAKTINKLTEKV